MAGRDPFEHVIQVPDAGFPGIFLRPLERSDLSAWFAYLTLPEVFEHTSWNVQSLNDLELLFQTYESSAMASPCRLAIVDQQNGNLVGTVGFHTISDVNRSAEIAFDLAPSYWGHGIATAVCNSITEWSYQAYDFLRVQATALETNLRSQRVLEKCGFQYEGLLRAYRMVRGKPGHFKMYARLTGDTARTGAAR